MMKFRWIFNDGYRDRWPGISDDNLKNTIEALVGVPARITMIA